MILSLRLLWKLWLTNVLAPELDVEHFLHSAQDALVRRCSAELELINDSWSLVNSSSQIFLGHFRFHSRSRLCDRFSNCLPNCVGLNDVV